MRIRYVLLGALVLVALGVILVSCSRGGAREEAMEPTAREDSPALADDSATVMNAQALDPAPQEDEGTRQEAEAGHEEDKAHEEAEAEHDGDEAHQEDEADGHGAEEHVGGQHGVPPEAIAVKNPVPATEESIALGAQIYAQNCVVCHGANGKGDGPAAASLPKKPANLHARHVQANTDGALFWIISHGKPNSPMPPWDNVLTEEERWHVVNFLRTFQDELGELGSARQE